MNSLPAPNIYLLLAIVLVAHLCMCGSLFLGLAAIVPHYDLPHVISDDDSMNLNLCGDPFPPPHLTRKQFIVVTFVDLEHLPSPYLMGRQAGSV